MGKIALLFISIWGFYILSPAQNEPRKPCPRYDDLIENGDKHFKDSAYFQALQSYQAAAVAAAECEITDTTSISRIKKLVAEIDTLRVQANRSSKEIQKQQEKNERIINAFYFYKGKFGLAVNENKQYGFIDKDGYTKIDFQYSYAQPFEERTGFALVSKPNPNSTSRFDEMKTNLESIENIIKKEKLNNKDTIKKWTIDSEINRMFQDTLVSKITQWNKLIKNTPEPEQTKNDSIQSKKGTSNTKKENDSQKIDKLKKEFPDVISNVRNNIISRVKAVKNINYLIDTLKQEYRLSYEPDTAAKEVVALDLRENGLTEIPDTVFFMKQLKILLLSNNNLSSIPDKIAELSNLEYLDISGNDIHKLFGLGKLTDLKVFKFDWEKMDSLGSCPYWEKIKNLDLSYMSLTRLPAGFEQLKNLSDLSLSNNQFTLIPEQLNYLKNLKYFNLSGNQISKLEGLDNLKELQTFDISNNQIIKLEGLENLKKLQAFNLSGNQISKLEGLENLNALQTFDIAYNQISKLEGLESLTKLQTLNISANQISKLQGIDNLKELQTFNIVGNQVSKLEGLEGLKNLQTFDISNNQISKLEGLENLKELQTFNISVNQISKLEGLENLADLQAFDIAYNQISKLEGLENLADLQAFNLSGNQISKLEGLENLKELQAFNLSGNQISKLEGLDNLKELQTFDIAYNQISKLEGLESLINLQVFNFDWNKIDNLPAIPYWPKLKELYLNEQNLNRLPIGFEQMINLKILGLHYNEFKTIPEQINMLKNLEELYLFNNQISKIQRLNYLKNLKVLNLTSNEIKRLEGLDSLNNLQLFEFDWNKIDTLPETPYWSKVENLNLSNSKLDKLPVGFEQLNSLKTLDLINNQLEYIPAQVHQLANLEELNLTINQISSVEGLEKLKNLKKLYISTAFLEDKNSLKPFENIIEDNTDYTEWVRICLQDSSYELAKKIRSNLNIKNIELPVDQYGNISWYLIFCHDFEGAIWAGEKYRDKGGSSIGLLSNLAMGYLYSGNFKDALEIYDKYKNMPDERWGTGKVVFLKDLDEVAAAYIPPKNPEDVARIRKFLAE